MTEIKAMNGIKTIRCYDDFIKSLFMTGMSMGGPNDEHVFSLCNFFGDEIEWHTEKPDTDPWEWRMRVLNERDDIAYGKLFFKKSGYITKDWFPYFYAARRDKTSLKEAYAEGKISQPAKLIYEILKEERTMPLHLLKSAGGFSKENKAAFERGLTELQMKMYITMCGQKRKRSEKGEEYGWSSTVFCLVEDFFTEDILEEAGHIDGEAAFWKISEQIVRFNPKADPKKVKKFVLG